MSKSRDLADSAATINYIDTVTSNVQDQIDNIDALPSQTGNTGKFLTTNGTAAAWDAVDVSSEITGTLPVANGGTGATTLTANNVLLGNGTSAPQAVAPSTAGNVLTSDGTTWASTAPAGGGSWDQVEVITAAASSTIDIESFTTDYDIYRIFFTLEGSVTYPYPLIRLKAGGSYQTSLYAYLSIFMNPNLGTTYTQTRSTSSSRIQPSGDSFTAGDYMWGSIDVGSVNQSGQPPTIGYDINYTLGTVTQRAIGTAQHNSDGALEGIRFYGSGTLTGKVIVLGLKNSAA